MLNFPRAEAQFSMHQWRLALSLTMIVFLLTACNTTIPHASIYKRGNRIYQIGAEVPFSGVVVGTERVGNHPRPLAYEKAYANGLQDGFTKYWYQDGQLESVIPYKNGKIDGVVISYYPNGKKRSKVHYVKGLRGGSKGELFWSPDGRIRRG